MKKERRGGKQQNVQPANRARHLDTIFGNANGMEWNGM